MNCKPEVTARFENTAPVVVAPKRTVSLYSHALCDLISYVASYVSWVTTCFGDVVVDSLTCLNIVEEALISAGLLAVRFMQACNPT